MLSNGGQPKKQPAGVKRSTLMGPGGIQSKHLHLFNHYTNAGIGSTNAAVRRAKNRRATFDCSAALYNTLGQREVPHDTWTKL